MPGRAGGQSHGPQKRPAAGAPAAHARRGADAPNLPCDPAAPEGFPDPPSLPRRGKMPAHATSFPYLLPQGGTSRAFVKASEGGGTVDGSRSPLASAPYGQQPRRKGPNTSHCFLRSCSKNALHLEVALWLSFSMYFRQGK